MGTMRTLNPIILSHVKTESGKLVIWKDEVINSILQRAIATEGMEKGNPVFLGGIPIHRPLHSTTSGGIE